MELKKIIKKDMRLLVVDKETGLGYKSTIQEINNEHIAITIPCSDLNDRLPNINTRLKFFINADDGVITFTSSIMGSMADEILPLYLIAWPLSFERYQRREYYRQPCIIDALYWVLPAPARDVHLLNPDLAFSLGEPQKATVLDLSGGGLRLASKAKHEVDDLLAICLYLQSSKENKEVWVQGRVIRHYSPVQQREQLYQYAVSYCGIQEKTKETIIRFLFTVMRGKLK